MCLQALKEEGSVKEADRAFARSIALDTKEMPSLHAMRISAQMRQQKGEHGAAIRILDKAIAFQKEDYVRGCVSGFGVRGQVLERAKAANSKANALLHSCT